MNLGRGWWGSLVSPRLALLALTALIVCSFAFLSSDVTPMLPILGLLLVQVIQKVRSFGEFFKIFWTPFLPLVLMVTLVAPFQETTTETLNLISVTTLYLLARAARFVFPLESVLTGLVWTGLVVGVFRQLSLLPFVDAVPLVLKIADVNGRNPAGIAVAIGLVASAVLMTHRTSAIQSKSFRTISFVSLTALTLASDTLSASIAAFSSVGVVALLYRAQSGGIPVHKTRLRSWILIAPALGFVGLVTMVNFVWASPPNVLKIFDRDFSSLTGRTAIWRCYFQAVVEGEEDPWQATIACLPFSPPHLQSVFLQAHLLAGVPGLLAVSLAFLFSLILSWKRIRSAGRMSSSISLVFAIAAAIFGLVLGFVESYLFTAVFPAFSVFLGHPEPKSSRENL